MTAVATTARVAVLAALAGEARSAAVLAARGWQVQLSGIGPVRARRAAERLLAAGVHRLLVWGTAGGLDTALQPGAVLLPDIIVKGADGRRFPVSMPWHVQLVQALAPLGASVMGDGILVTVPEAAATHAAKRALAAQSGACMVDMEAAAVAEAAMQAGAEFAVIRVLADDVDIALPAAVLAALDSPHLYLAVLAGLLRRPQDLPAVLRLDRTFRRAYRRLAAVAHLLAAASTL
ncbi:MAG: nucleosidase [Gammaproteobacteria bacterium]|nr:nucleosidase [Gammaproteobacteria bacterium]MDE2024047.1 nucleosidase [Gammaproteobacteria bacterium]MDE2140177.1 nucleosidase [Gammaproteobacteria bacterium]